MLNLSDNLFNACQRRHQPKLRLWRYAGLMLTWRCTASCRFCYYNCGPKAGGLMSTQTAIAAWEGLVRIAGKDARIHLTGGEPFLYFENLFDIMKEARRLKLPPAEYVETNAQWPGADKDVRDRLALLDACGMERLKISWDAFHEEFVDVEQVRRLIRLAGEVLGPDRVLVRWQKHLDRPTGIRHLPEAEKTAILRQALADDPCRFTGRAAAALAHLAESRPAEAFAVDTCKNALLSAKGVHIDPDGNVFIGQCSGMIAGNVAAHQGLDTLWKNFEPNQTDFWKVLYTCGPFGLLEEAQKLGYTVRQGYASKCHLCTDLRGFFFDKGHFSSIIGPLSCYNI